MAGIDDDQLAVARLPVVRSGRRGCRLRRRLGRFLRRGCCGFFCRLRRSGGCRFRRRGGCRFRCRCSRRFRCRCSRRFFCRFRRRRSRGLRSRYRRRRSRGLFRRPLRRRHFLRCRGNLMLAIRQSLISVRGSAAARYGAKPHRREHTQEYSYNLLSHVSSLSRHTWIASPTRSKALC